MSIRAITILSLLFVFFPLLAEQPNELYEQATTFFSAGDTTGALKLTDKILSENRDDYRTYLLRGQLKLAAGDLDGARLDFRRTLFSPDSILRAQAHVGKGDILYLLPGKKNQAVTSYRIATQVDPGCREAYYKLFVTGTEMGDARGYRTAAGAIADLICIDPTYRGVFPVWRDSLLDKTPEEINHVIDCVSSYVEANPELCGWLVGLARTKFYQMDIEMTLGLLADAERLGEEYSRVEWHLLMSRCLLARDDTTGFEKHYQLALDEAERNGDYERIVIEAEPIFTPEEKFKASKIKTTQQWAVFFRAFWKRRDPDPITPVNERLVNHYWRLYEAHRVYRNLHPHSKFNMSEKYNRMLTILRLQEGDETVRGRRPENPLTEFGEYEYDPELMFGRSRGMNFDQRGLLFVRHGPPDEIRLPESTEYEGAAVAQAEVWRYGEVFYPFQYTIGGGTYRFAPYAFRGDGNIQVAMQTDSYRDGLPSLVQSAYGANFRAKDGGVAFEIYQSIPVKECDTDQPPQSVIAVFDSTWSSFDADSSESQLVAFDRIEHFASVNSLSVPATSHNVVLRMDIPNKRCVKRLALTLREFPDPDVQMTVSGIVLGDVPGEYPAIHNRLGVDLLPRPDLVFPVSATIMVYMEIYGIKSDRSGKHSYFIEATISLLEEYEAPLETLFGKLAWWNEKRSSSLTLTFDRSHENVESDALPETFLIDASFLVPGKYRLQIDIHDDYTRQVAGSSAEFEIRD